MAANFTDDWAGSATTNGLNGRSTTTGSKTWATYGAFAADAKGFNLDGSGNLKLSSSNGCLSVTEAESADHFCDMIVATTSSAAANFAAPAVRGVDQSNVIYLHPYSSTQLIIYKRVAGTVTQVAQLRALTSALAVGDVLRLKIDGTTVTAFIARAATPTSFTQLDTSASVASWTVSDSAFTGVTKAGLWGKGTLNPAAGDVSGGSNAAATVAITSGDPKRVVQRKKGTSAATIAPSFSYTATAPAELQRRLETAAGALVSGYDWATVSGVTIASGAITGAAVSVPEDTALGSYVLKFRTRDGSGTVLATTQTSTFTVGLIAAGLGQSNEDGMFSASSDGTGAAAAYGTGAFFFDKTAGSFSQPASGSQKAGAHLTNALVAYFGVPVAVMDVAVSGTAIAYHAPSFTRPSNNATSAEGTNWQAIKDAITASGGDAEVILWHQGEGDTSGPYPAADYGAALDAILAGLKTHTGRSGDGQLLFGVGIISRNPGGSASDANWNSIRGAAYDWATTPANATKGAFLSHYAIDLPFTSGSNLHYSDAGYQEQAYRQARSAAAKKGLIAYDATGPAVTAVSWSGNKVTAAVALNGSTALTVPAAPTGFLIKDNGVAVAVTAGAASGTNKIVLTMASALTGPVTFEDLSGREPDVSSLVRGD